MRYPNRSEYETPIRYNDKFVFDTILRQGKPIMRSDNPNILFCDCGGKAIVYKIQTQNRNYAVKCWFEDLGDLKKRYKEVDDYLKSSNLPYFVEFSYQEDGILVNGTKYPIVRMEWIDGINLKKFIGNSKNDATLIKNVAEQFLKMVETLHKNHISHGDLQHGNILYKNDGKICLVDYDSLCVPILQNETNNLQGLPGYQHHKRKNFNKLGLKCDYFSELVIYLSLRAIAENPSLWNSIEQEERLLFAEKDFENPVTSKIFQELMKMSSDVQQLTKSLKNFCTETDITKLKPLEEIAVDNTWTFTKSAQPQPPTTSKPKETKTNENAWNFSNSQGTTTATTTTKSIWDKIDTKQTNTNIWDKFNTQPTDKNVWNNLNQNKTTKTYTPIQKTTQSTFNKPTNDSIWDKLVTKISNIWDKISVWFN